MAKCIILHNTVVTKEAIAETVMIIAISVVLSFFLLLRSLSMLLYIAKAGTRIGTHYRLSGDKYLSNLVSCALSHDANIQKNTEYANIR